MLQCSEPLKKDWDFKKSVIVHGTSCVFFIFVGFSIIPEGVLVKGFTSLSRKSSYFFNTNLGGEVFLPRWFSLNNLETVKAVN